MEIRLSDHFTYKKLYRFVLPSIFMMVFISIYGVVDGLFVSNFVGKTAFASINLVMPFIMVLGGMGFMIGTGGTALVAKTLGEGDKKKANRYFSMMVIFTVSLGAALTAIGIIFIRPISYFLGATESMINDCVTYGTVIIAFTTSFMLQNLFQNFLVTAEKPKLGLLSTVFAGVTNMLLDALFIAVLGWGVLGAAFATGISQLVGALIPFVYFLRGKNGPLKFSLARLELRPIVRACANGSSELMSNISSSVVSMLYNFQLMKHIGEDGVSAYGVLMYVQFVFIAIFIGYVIGCAPIIGYNYGADNRKEMQNIFTKSVISVGIGGIVLACLAAMLSRPLSMIFVGYDESLLKLTESAFLIASISFIFAGFNIFSSSLFTALNNGLISAVISFLRTLLFQTLCIIILPIILGTEGIWWSITVAEIFAFIISLIFVISKNKRYHYIPVTADRVK